MLNRVVSSGIDQEGTRSPLAFFRNAVSIKIGLIALISTHYALLQLFLTASGKSHTQCILCKEA